MTKRGYYFVTGLIVFAGLFQFFNRVCRFHDEIINTWKASQVWILDYAKRPFLYFLNSLGYHFFGGHPLALTFLGYLCYLLTALLIFRMASMKKGALPPVIAPLMFAFVSLSYVVGISAMPHAPAGMMLALTLWLFFIAWDQKSVARTKLYFFAAGICCALTPLTHLTTYPATLLLVGVSFLVSISGFFPDRFRFPLKSDKAKTFIFVLVGFILVLVLTELIYLTFYERSYFLLWRKSPGRLADQARFGKYFKPFSFYFLLLLKHYFAVVCLLVFYFVVACALALRKSGGGLKSLLKMFKNRYVLLAAALYLLSFLALSAVTWKFERILVNYSALTVLLLFFILDDLFVFLKSHLSSSIIKYWYKGTMIFLACLFAYEYYESCSRELTFIKKYRPIYSTIFETIRNIPSQKVSFLGSQEGVRKMHYHIQGGGKELEIVDPAELDGDISSIFMYFYKRNQRYFVTSRKGFADTFDTLRSKGRWSRFFHKLGTYAGVFGIWRIDFFDTTYSVNRGLRKIPSGSRWRVAFFKELPQFDLLNRLTSSFSVRQYHLSFNMNVKKIVRYVVNSGSTHIILPGGKEWGIHSEKMQTFVNAIREAGFIEVASSRIIPLDRTVFTLWSKKQQEE